MIVLMTKPESALADLAPLPRASLRDTTLDALRSAIVLGQIPPGSHLSEVALSNSFGISRGTLREALRLIQREGLAVEDTRGRLKVPDLNAHTITETYQVREALEAMAGHLVVTGVSVDTAVAELRARVQDMADSRTGTLVQQVETDLAFHRGLCRLSGNAALLDSWEALAGLVRMSILFAGPEKAMANMLPARHAQIVDSMASNRSDVVVRRIHQHFCEALEVLTGDLPNPEGRSLALRPGR